MICLFSFQIWSFWKASLTPFRKYFVIYWNWWLYFLAFIILYMTCFCFFFSFLVSLLISEWWKSSISLSLISFPFVTTDFYSCLVFSSLLLIWSTVKSYSTWSKYCSRYLISLLPFLLLYACFNLIFQYCTNVKALVFCFE